MAIFSLNYLRKDMETGRARYDNEVSAKELKKGDMLHLTFMGGDDYVQLSDVRQSNGLTYWTSYCGLSDVVSNETKVWRKQ